MNPQHQRPPLTLPPWLLAGTEREPIAESFSRAKWLLAAYWLLTASGFVVLMAAVMGQSTSASSLSIFIGLVLTSAVGILFGNLLGMLRVRGWVVHVAVWVATFGSCAVGIAGGAFLVAFAITFLWSVACGHLTLQRRFSLWALWIPVVCWTGAMLTIIERSGGTARWQTGHKETVWHPFALGLLFVMVVMFFGFLAGQDRYHQLVWQAGANVAPPAQWRHHDGRGGVRLTGKGALTLLLLAAVVSGVVALISPYLWRVGPQHGDGNREGDGQPRRDDREDRPPQRPRFDGESLRRAMERALRRAREQGKDLLPFVPLFLLNRPLRRWWLLRRLRKPLLHVPPSQRAANLWRYVVIALGDAGHSPRGGETLEQVVTRVNTTRSARNHPPVAGITETAEVYERIRYGLGIPEGSLDTLQSRAEQAFDDLRRPLSAWERFKSWFRRID